MSQAETENSIFLSPIFWEYPKMKWQGKTLTVYPPENLQADRTYVLTVGAGAFDSHNNRIGKSVSYAYSTGASIDSGAISGALFFDEQNRSTYDIWAYDLQNPDSLPLWNNIPDFVTQLDSLGKFELIHLNAGNFLIVAVEDKNDDLFWDPQNEGIGLPPDLYKLGPNDKITELVLRPIRRDTAAAYISKATAPDKNKITIENSQPVSESLALKSSSYLIKSQDSDSSILQIFGVYLGIENRIMIETSDQDPDTRYKIYPQNLQSIWGNQFDSNGIEFRSHDSPDTTGPFLIKTIPAGSPGIVQQDTLISLYFSERIAPENIARSILVVADSLDTLKFIPLLQKPNQLDLKFLSKIPRDSDIDVKVYSDSIRDSYGNYSPDSLFEFKFRIAPLDTFGTVIVSARDQIGYPILARLIELGRSPNIYEAKADKKGTIVFKSVLPGSYSFSYFVDSDNDGAWTPGFLTPLIFAEYFNFLPDTIAVRSRWQTDIGEISVPNGK